VGNRAPGRAVRNTAEGGCATLLRRALDHADAPADAPLAVDGLAAVVRAHACPEAALAFAFDEADSSRVVHNRHRYCHTAAVAASRQRDPNAAQRHSLADLEGGAKGGPGLAIADWGLARSGESRQSLWGARILARSCTDFGFWILDFGLGPGGVRPKSARRADGGGQTAFLRPPVEDDQGDQVCAPPC
jgi:hypothetical protein